MNNYFSFCESLWKGWLNDKLVVPPEVGKMFDMDAAPEPYLTFAAEDQAIVALTTNPGLTIENIQSRSVIRAGSGPVNSGMDYRKAARSFSSFYENNLKGKPAGRRITALQELAQLAGFKGVLQVEVCPFHSRSLPKKTALVNAMAKGGLLGEYAKHVRELIKAKPVVVVSAVWTGYTLCENFKLTPWLSWQADIAGIDTCKSDFVSLTEKPGKITSCAFISRASGPVKALVLMMGGNHLPGVIGLTKLAKSIQR